MDIDNKTPAQESGDNLTEYYRTLYNRECEKNDELVAQLEEAEKHIEELDYKLGRIKNSFAWKLSKPLRGAMHTCVRIRDVYRQYGNPIGVARKIRRKLRQKNAEKQHGLASFPDAEEAKRQRETRFPREITFSILVPLYNTPEKFLRATGITRMWAGSASSTRRRIPASSTARLSGTWGFPGIRTCALRWPRESISASSTTMTCCTLRCCTSI